MGTFDAYGPIARRSDATLMPTRFGLSPDRRQPTLHERVADYLTGNFYGEENRDKAERLANVVDFTPPAMAYDTGRAVGEGIQQQDPQAVAMEIAMAAVPPPVKKLGRIGAAEARKGVRAFHGSPHDFERFDLGRIGTGEGAQAYGHGLYFAENEGVARDYRNKLADRPKVLVGGEEVPPTTGLGVFQKNDADATVAARLSNWARAQTVTGGAQASAADAVGKVRADLEHGMELAQQSGNFDLWMSLNDQKLSLQRMEERGIDLGHGGKMYEVNIDADPEAFLDWDKPLSEQPANAISILERIRGDAMSAQNPYVPAELNTVGDVITYGRAATRSNAEKELRQAGIPGIKYLDQGSRRTPFTGMQRSQMEARINSLKADIASGGGNQELMKNQLANMEHELAAAAPPTRNYVVFDDKLISIVKKYGIAGALAAGAINQMQADQLTEQGYQ